MNERFKDSYALYHQYKKETHTAKSLMKFKETKEYQDIMANHNIVPLGFIAYIATGVDFKGQNSTTIFSTENSKYNIIDNNGEIKENPSIDEIRQGLSDNTKYIPAMKGKERVYVRWDKEHLSFLRSIKAPLRNLTLYDGLDSIYCKTSTYEMQIISGNMLCINTAGACFIKPFVDGITCETILSQIHSPKYKEFLKKNINNSLCLTPNDLKMLPIALS